VLFSFHDVQSLVRIGEIVETISVEFSEATPS